MPTQVNAIPDGYHTLTPYLIINGASQAMAFYQQAFGAVERCRMPMPDGKIGHAEMQIGNSFFMLADESADTGHNSPQSLSGTPVSFVLYVEDVDALFQQALDAGATLKLPLENKFYGDRMGTVSDPFGHIWSLATHIEDVSPEEMEARMAAQYANMAVTGQ